MWTLHQWIHGMNLLLHQKIWTRMHITCKVKFFNQIKGMVFCLPTYSQRCRFCPNESKLVRKCHPAEVRLLSILSKCSRDMIVRICLRNKATKPCWLFFFHWISCTSQTVRNVNKWIYFVLHTNFPHFKENVKCKLNVISLSTYLGCMKDRIKR